MPAMYLLIGCANPTPPIEQTFQQNHISGVYIGMPEQDLKDHLGPPESVDETSVDETTVLTFSGLDVSLMAGGLQLDSPKVVTGISTTSPTSCFRDDICPGDRLRKFKKMLGQVDAPKEDHRLLYQLSSDGCMLSVKTQDLRTTDEIYIYCLR